MPLTRDSPSIQGDVPGPDPARAPPSKAVAGGARLSGAAGGGLPCQARPAMRSAAAPGERACLVHVWCHAIGAERSVAVSSGAWFAQVVAAILGEQALVRNPDKDEVRGSRPALRAAALAPAATRVSHRGTGLTVKCRGLTLPGRVWRPVRTPLVVLRWERSVAGC
jgi:hypothetical protein